MERPFGRGISRSLDLLAMVIHRNWDDPPSTPSCKACQVYLRIGFVSSWPLASPNGGHLSPQKVTSRSKIDHFEEPGGWAFMARSCCLPQHHLRSWVTGFRQATTNIWCNKSQSIVIFSRQKDGCTSEAIKALLVWIYMASIPDMKNKIWRVTWICNSWMLGKSEQTHIFPKLWCNMVIYQSIKNHIKQNKSKIKGRRIFLTLKNLSHQEFQEPSVRLF